MKRADQVKIRLSRWTGSRIMPRPLGLPEEELLQLLDAASGESWSRATPGSGQAHEITPNGASLLGEGFI